MGTLMYNHQHRRIIRFQVGGCDMREGVIVKGLNTFRLGRVVRGVHRLISVSVGGATATGVIALIQ